MVKTYLKMAFRGFKSDRLFSAINVAGLSVGLAIIILLALYIANERSFDGMYAKKERIHRVLVETDGDFGYGTWATAPPVLAATMRKEVINVETAARMLKHDFGSSANIRANEQNFTENDLFWVDMELFDIFDIPFLKGNPQTALTEPNTIALSEATSRKYFGSVDPMGKTLLVDNNNELTVTGVFADFPPNSSINANMLASSNGTWFYENEAWSNASFETFCLLKDKVSKKTTIAQMGKMLDAHTPKEEQWYSLSLQPLGDVHLYSSDYGNSYAAHIGDAGEVRTMAVLALVVLLIAAMNYINLTTAKSLKRSKEVGVNKTLGASRKSLLARFYVEAATITGVSVVLGAVLAILFLPIFQSLVGRVISFGTTEIMPFMVGVGLLWLAIALVAGAYPAFYLSRFAPRAALSNANNSAANVVLRKGLVVMQFAVSVILLVGVLTIYLQTKYIQDKKLGFTPDNVVAVSVNGIRDKATKTALAQEIEKMAAISAVGYSQGFPGRDVSGRSLRKKPTDEHGLNIKTNVAESSIVEVLDLKLLAGTSLPKNKMATDTTMQVVLNKKAVDYLGLLPEEAVGKEVFIGVPQTVVGVVEDFNYESLHQPIGAYAFHNAASESKGYLLAKFKGNEESEVLAMLKGKFGQVVPYLDFNYSLLDQNLAKLYEREKRTGQTTMLFCLLAIFVATLGLLGLSAYMAEQRRKEIGIRKVLGASVPRIAQMLTKDFARLIIVALVIGFPAAYFLADTWLQGFAYRIELNWWVFALSGITILAVAISTVSFQSIKAAVTNPVKSLRTE
ncbi:ABC transporter permease [Pseudozobellia sp. WGM2]|uniref:ABC transporter permease n=1 Tax=Pseudozobellia sp. WGM2 TaxID=2787625 RepID=UPI001ADED09C|nr:ABC transporter permease [Pseudozobellia sp. WGM2]